MRRVTARLTGLSTAARWSITMSMMRMVILLRVRIAGLRSMGSLAVLRRGMASLRSVTSTGIRLAVLLILTVRRRLPRLRASLTDLLRPGFLLEMR